jgi:hypothetical protein
MAAECEPAEWKEVDAPTPGKRKVEPSEQAELTPSAQAHLMMRMNEVGFPVGCHPVYLTPTSVITITPEGCLYALDYGPTSKMSDDVYTGEIGLTNARLLKESQGFRLTDLPAFSMYKCALATCDVAGRVEIWDVYTGEKKYETQVNVDTSDSDSATVDLSDAFAITDTHIVVVKAQPDERGDVYTCKWTNPDGRFHKFQCTMDSPRHLTGSVYTPGRVTLTSSNGVGVLDLRVHPALYAFAWSYPLAQVADQYEGVRAGATKEEHANTASYDAQLQNWLKWKETTDLGDYVVDGLSKVKPAPGSLSGLMVKAYKCAARLRSCAPTMHAEHRYLHVSVEATCLVLTSPTRIGRYTPETQSWFFISGVNFLMSRCFSPSDPKHYFLPTVTANRELGVFDSQSTLCGNAMSIEPEEGKGVKMQPSDEEKHYGAINGNMMAVISAVHYIVVHNYSTLIFFRMCPTTEEQQANLEALFENMDAFSERPPEELAKLVADRRAAGLTMPTLEELAKGGSWDTVTADIDGRPALDDMEQPADIEWPPSSEDEMPTLE